MSILEDSTLGVENPQSREEDEEIEEQRRRQQELADLLATGIQEFNYDESTMNSSVTSVEGGVEPNCSIKTKNILKYEDTEKTSLDNISVNLSDAIEQSYKNANQQEQLKILYDVRVREINSLRNEFSLFRDDKSKEINVLKNKITLGEAEIRHLQVTLSNAESLLVEKSELIKKMKENMNLKNQELEDLKKIVEQQNFEICTYKSTVNELYLKLADHNPLGAGDRKLNSEELRKAHQDQFIKLETLLQEQTKKVQILEKDKSRLEADVKKILKEKNTIEEENNLTIMGLSKKLQNTQQQCKDLFLLGEAIKKESDHFKERLDQLDTNKLDLSGNSNKMDKETLIVHVEKLKRMLLDKETELNTLKAKLKFYDSNIEELFQYRQLLSEMFSSEIKPCNNLEHEELIIFMKGQLQSYQQAVEDRNNQIMNLNSVNKELQEKIEEMIQQTRTDIQNIAQKYSLPQLETMSNELKNAEETINQLKQQLLEAEEGKQSVVGKFEKVQKEYDKLHQKSVKDRTNFENVLTQIKEELKKTNEEKNKLLTQVEEFQQTDLQLSEENERVKMQIQKICLKLGLSEADIFESDSEVHEINTLKSRYGSLHDQLQQVVAHLENMSPKKANVNIILKLKKQFQNYLNNLKNEKIEQKDFEEKLEQWSNLLTDFTESLNHSNNFTKAQMKESELRDSIEDLTNAKTMLEGEKFALEYQLKARTHELEEAKREIFSLNENRNVVIEESENNKRIIQKLYDEVENLKRCLAIMEQNKLELENRLDNSQKQLNTAKQEIIDLNKEVNAVNENNIRRSISHELKDMESVLEDDKTAKTDVFQKYLQAQLLKIELALRDRLQEENLEKLRRIEEQYKKVITEKSELYNKEKEKWQHQEANFRKKFATVLEECGKKIQELEEENIVLIKQVNTITQEYNTFRSNAICSIDKFKKTALDSRQTVEDSNKKWSALLEYYMITATKIEKQHQKSAKNIMKKIALSQTELNLIESMYEEKIKKFKQEQLSRFPNNN